MQKVCCALLATVLPLSFASAQQEAESASAPRAEDSASLDEVTVTGGAPILFRDDEIGRDFTLGLRAQL